jgi:hypothetical protein
MKLELIAMGVKYFQNFFIVFSKILAKNNLINTIDFQYVLSYGCWLIFYYESPVYIIPNSRFRFFIKSQNKHLHLSVQLFYVLNRLKLTLDISYFDLVLALIANFNRISISSGKRDRVSIFVKILVNFLLFLFGVKATDKRSL